VEIWYFLHSETTGNKIEYVALYIETGSEIRGSSGRVRRVRADGVDDEATTGDRRRNLGNFTFSTQSYSRDSLVVILSGDESWCEKARVVLRPHGFERVERDGRIEIWRHE